MNNKKIFAISLVVIILLIALFVYRQPIQEQLVESRNRIAITQTLQDFYKGYIEAINTNQNWPELVDTYTSQRAKVLLAARAGFFVDNASQGKQHLAEIVSPITIRFYESAPSQVKVLVDFDLEEGIVGHRQTIYAIEKLLVMEKIGDKWIIVGDFDRSDNFNEWANEQNFLTVQTIIN